MQCPECGRKNRDGAAFCAWCGHTLIPAPDADAPAIAAPPAAEPPSLTETQEPPPAEPPAEEPASAAEVRPLAVGDLIAERYRITEILEQAPEGARFAALDLLRCTFCGHEQDAVGEAYCASCGAQMQEGTVVELLERLPDTPEGYDDRFTAGDKDYYVRYDMVDAETSAEGPTDLSRLRLEWGFASDAGVTRDHNEDYVEVHLLEQAPGLTLGLFQVADGLGGQEAGEVASQLCAQSVWQSLHGAIWAPTLADPGSELDDPGEALLAAVRQANEVLFNERAARASDMSTTLNALLVVGNSAYVANVGDSRTYLWDQSGLTRITRDHSFVQRLVDAGALSPDDVYTHPKRNLIYQSMGDQVELEPDLFRQELVGDQRYLLCSDGLWEMVREEGIQEVLMSETDPQRACDRLVANANLAGGEDNISVIIVHVMPNDGTLEPHRGGNHG